MFTLKYSKTIGHTYAHMPKNWTHRLKMALGMLTGSSTKLNDVPG